VSHTPEYLHSLKKESVLQSVINRLTDAIKSGELKPGDKMPSEVELAEALGVARSSVREAIKILSYLGVLESRRSEGTFVCSGFSESMIDPMVYGIYLNQDSVENLMELREMTETGMMRIAIAHHSESELRELEQILRKMEEAPKDRKDPVKAFFREDDRFHDKIAEMGKNPMADKINRIVRSLTYDLRYKTVSEMIASGRTEELIEAHRRLLEAIREGNLHNVSDKVRGSYYEEVVLEKRQ
jgi:DNA-binding FadR family transcriptional regulator